MSPKLNSQFARPATPPQVTYILICEGKTEEQYFKQWERLLRGKAKFRILGSVGSPITLVERAIAEKKYLVRSGIKASDLRVWCVGDRDDHHRMIEALDHARRKDIQYALSIPCIELWFLLHFEDQRAHLHRDEAIRRSKDHLDIPTKNLPSAALDILFQNVDTAVQRATHLERMHASNGSGPLENPRSLLHILVSQLQSL
ncbi:MAG: RloB family protein [Candidatus Nanopelagicaceae bacterium]|nr:RloB family protein [Candidatus Nanopelagicaceae bacterium]